MISVVIPLYNNQDTIVRAIRSVLCQSMQDFEIIVVDDGSTDNGASRVSDLGDGRITLIAQSNRGVSSARNRGIAESHGPLVAFLDADDEWDPVFLESVVSLYRQFPKCALFATAYRLIDSNGTIHNIRSAPTILNSKFSILNSNFPYFSHAAHSAPPFYSSSVMIRKDVLLSIGGFPKGIGQGEDLLTWARIAADHTIAYKPSPCCSFHVSSANSLGLPKRIPPDVDVVGNELVKIFNSHPDTPGLREYIALWHKMRASMFLRLKNHEPQCRHEIKLSQRWHHNSKLFIYRLLLFLPYPLRMSLLAHI